MKLCQIDTTVVGCEWKIVLTQHFECIDVGDKSVGRSGDRVQQLTGTDTLNGK